MTTDGLAGAAIVRGSSVLDVEKAWLGLPQTLYTSPGWLRTCESATSRQEYQVSTVEGLSEAGLLAWIYAGPGWVFNDPVALLRQDAVELSAQTTDAEAVELTRLRAALPADEGYPAVVSVLPGGYLPGLIRAQNATHATLPGLLDQLDQLAGREGARTMAVMHVPTEDIELAAALRERGYLSFRSSGDCVLRTSWPTLDDYLAWLPKKRRVAARHEIRVFHDQGHRLEISPMSVLGLEHARLHAAHLRRYGHAADEDAALAMIRSIQEHNDAMAFVVEARDQGGLLLGFVLVYDVERWLYPKMLGIRGDQTAFYTYFNLAYYGLVRHAVEHGFEAISYGPEAYEAKALRGCTLHPRDSFVLVPQPWRPTVSQLAGLLDRRYAARMAAAPWIFGPAGRASGAG